MCGYRDIASRKLLTLSRMAKKRQRKKRRVDDQPIKTDQGFGCIGLFGKYHRERDGHRAEPERQRRERNLQSSRHDNTVIRFALFLHHRAIFQIYRSLSSPSRIRTHLISCLLNPTGVPFLIFLNTRTFPATLPTMLTALAARISFPWLAGVGPKKMQKALPGGQWPSSPIWTI
jgi:hypothetical protein